MDMIFYDGHCGMCHRLVRFLLARDPGGDKFRFSPLGSEAFRKAVPAEVRAGLPDSSVVRTPDGQLLVRSDAAIYLLRRLGGGWKLLGFLGKVVPRPLRDAVYNGIARIRYRLFRRPMEACPLMPPEWRKRFELG